MPMAHILERDFFYREVSGLKPGGDAYVDGWVGRENDGLSRGGCNQVQADKEVL